MPLSRTAFSKHYFRLPLSAILFALLIASFAFIGAAQRFEPLASDFTNRQAAASVLGQPGFTTNASGAGAAGMFHPENAVVDPASKKVFVVELNNNRVLRFATAAALRQKNYAARQSSINGRRGSCSLCLHE